MIPPEIERRARWVLDSIGAAHVGFDGDDIAEGFFHLARVEEKAGPRDEHGRFRAEWSCLDPLDPPLERLRRKLGIQSREFTVARTHDVDSPWRWTPTGVRGAAARLK